MLAKRRLHKIGVIILLIGWVLITVGTSKVNSSHLNLTDGVNIQHDNDPFIHISILQSPVRFQILTPIKGTYRENSNGYGQMAVKTNIPVIVHFSVTDLSYTGEFTNKPYTLDATYWVNYPENSAYSFQPGKIYQQRLLNDTEVTTYFNIYGAIQIDSLTAQPAGTYEGTITITVSELY